MGQSALLFFVVLVMLSNSFSLCDANCTAVVNATKRAYFGQIDFIRRGMREDTAVAGFAEFMGYVIATAWLYNLNGSLSLGDVCLPDCFLSVHQDENGRLRKTVMIAEGIENSGSGVPFFGENDLAGNLGNTTKAALNNAIKQYQWKNISDYLMEGMPTTLNFSRLVFPSESDLRVEPFRNKSCYEFEQKYDVSGVVTMSADNLTANVLALVLQLIDMGVNSTKAKQLLAHNIAYTNMGVRCYGQETSGLQVPLYFLPEYARQGALLSRNNSVPLSHKATAEYIYEDGYNLVQLLSSHSSGGRLPTTVLNTFGNLSQVDLSWTSSDDIDTSILETQEIVLDSDVFEDTIENLANGLINMSITVVNELTSSTYLPESLNGSEVRVFHGSFGVGDRMDENAQLVRRWRSLLSSLRQRVPGAGRRPSSVLPRTVPFTVRMTCGASWMYIDRVETVSNELENCCAPICSYAAAGLSGTAETIFKEACCDACNEYMCDSGADDAAQDAADLASIELPECGSNCGGRSIPITI